MATQSLPNHLTRHGYESRKRLGLLLHDDIPPVEEAQAPGKPAPFRRELSREEGEILARMEEVRKQMSRTIENVGLSLEHHFQNIPPQHLQQEIEARFHAYDLDKNGTLERNEICEAMADLGKRPSEDELDEFFELFDTDQNGTIDLMEFEQMVRIKLHLLQPEGIVRSPSKSPPQGNEKEVHFQANASPTDASKLAFSAQTPNREPWNRDVHG